MIRQILLTLAVLIAGVAASACRTQYIPNTDVEDTDDNRRVIEFCEEYRKAVERKNVPRLLEMAHPAYYEDGGNSDSTDDIDYTGLRSYLKEQFAGTNSIRYEIRYRRVGKGRKNTIEVDFTYTASYRVPTEEGDVWRRAVADNRIELIPHGESYRILSGM